MEGAFNNHQTDSAGTDPSGAGLVTTEAPKHGANISANKSLPPVLVGMDKAEALAFVSRMFDTAAAGAVLWGDELLIKRFLTQCSRSGSSEIVRGYKRELRDFTLWRDSHHPNLHLREINAAFCQDWVSQLREQVEAGLMKPRTFNRRIAAISSLYRWASEPSRCSVTGVPRNPMPPRSLLHAPKTTRGLSDEQMGLLMATIAKAIHHDRNAIRDYASSEVLISWVAEFLKSLLSNGRTSKFSPMAVKFTSLEKDPKQGLFECPVTRSSFFSRLAAEKLTAMYFRAPAETDTSLDRQLDRSVASGAGQQGFTFTHTS